jgi:hypothetical protein
VRRVPMKPLSVYTSYWYCSAAVDQPFGNEQD